MGWFLPFCAGREFYDPWFKLRFPTGGAQSNTFFPNHAFVYPLAEDFNFFFRDTWPFWRHSFIQVCRRGKFNKPTIIGISGYGNFSTFSTGKKFGSGSSWKVHPSFSHRCDTPHNSFKNRHHLVDKIHFHDKQDWQRKS